MYFRNLYVRNTSGTITIIGVTILLMCRFCTGDLPSFITKCPRDTNLEKCAVRVLEQMRPYLANGDLGNGIKTAPLEPLVLNQVSLNSPEMNMTLSNLIISGPSNYQVKSVKIDPEKLLFGVKLFTPVFSFTSQYQIRIKLGLLDVQGEGDVKGELIGLNVNLRIQLGTQGNSVKLVKLQNRVKIDKGKYHFSNLFNGNNVLSQAGNELINSQSPALIKIGTPGLEKEMKKINIDIVNKVLRSVTLDELFL